MEVKKALAVAWDVFEQAKVSGPERRLMNEAYICLQASAEPKKETTENG